MKIKTKTNVKENPHETKATRQKNSYVINSRQKNLKAI
jgi:hypothetical protein